MSTVHSKRSSSSRFSPASLRGLIGHHTAPAALMPNTQVNASGSFADRIATLSPDATPVGSEQPGRDPIRQRPEPRRRCGTPRRRSVRQGASGASDNPCRGSRPDRTARSALDGQIQGSDTRPERAQQLAEQLAVPERLAGRGEPHPLRRLHAATSTRRTPAAVRSACSSGCRGSRSARGPAGRTRAPSRATCSARGFSRGGIVFMTCRRGRRQRSRTSRRHGHVLRRFERGGLTICGTPSISARSNTPPSALTLATRGSRRYQTGCDVPPHGRARPSSCWPGTTSCVCPLLGIEGDVGVLLQVVRVRQRRVEQDRLGRGHGRAAAPEDRDVQRVEAGLLQRDLGAAISPVVYICAMPGASSSPAAAKSAHPSFSSQVINQSCSPVVSM